jgi:hypothetical protein
MGMAIDCVLEQALPGAPIMEGKSLLAAYLGENVDAEISDPAVSDDIIRVDFGGTAERSGLGEQGVGPALGPLQAFICAPETVRWHDPDDGLAAVRGILPTLRDGTATVSAPPDFLPGFEDDEELMQGVIFDLETLEAILAMASERGVRFALVFSV